MGVVIATVAMDAVLEGKIARACGYNNSASEPIGLCIQIHHTDHHCAPMQRFREFRCIASFRKSFISEFLYVVGWLRQSVKVLFANGST